MDPIKRGFKYKIPYHNSQDNDFLIDKIFHRITTRLIVMIAGIVLIKQYYFSPISCWVPKELKRYEKFINRYCWLTGTYYASQVYDENVFSFTATKENVILYYQWVHVFLLFQAFLFYLPRIIWNFLSQKILDADIISMINAARKYEQYGYTNDVILKYLISHLSLAHLNTPEFMQKLKRAAHDPLNEINFKHLNLYSSHSNLTYLKHRLSKSYLCLTYVFIKFLYVAITLIQIWITDIFLR